MEASLTICIDKFGYKYSFLNKVRIGEEEIIFGCTVVDFIKGLRQAFNNCAKLVSRKHQSKIASAPVIRVLNMSSFELDDYFDVINDIAIKRNVTFIGHQGL